MKKLISCMCLLLCALVASAQDFGVWEYTHQASSKDPFSALYYKIQRSIAARQKLPWAKAVEKQKFDAQPHGLIGMNNFDHLSGIKNVDVSYTGAKVYEARTQAWQAALKQNDVLQHFKVVVPNPQAVLDMKDVHAQYITAFLKAPVTQGKADARYTPQSVETYKKFLVRVTLKPNAAEGPVHLIFNCYTREMYVAYPQAAVPGVPLEKLNAPRHKGLR